MKRWILPLLLLALLLAGCGGEAGEELLIYYRTAGDSASVQSLNGEACGLSGRADEIPAALDLLLGQPADVTLLSPFPSGTTVNGWTLEKGRLTVDFSEPYSTLYGIDLTLADYCVVLTLSQFEGVEEVTVTVAGEEVPGRNQQVFRTEDVLLNGDEAQQVVLDVQLCFPLADGSGLGTEYREVLVGEDETPAEALLQALCDGPTSGTMTAFLPAERGGTTVSVDEGVCVVELDETWRGALPEREQSLELTVYALVNSLSELDTVDRVQVLAEGRPLWGGGPLEPDYRLSISTDAETAD